MAAKAQTSRRLLVLGAGPAQLGLLEAARAEGIWTAVCDRDPAAPGFELAARRCIVSIEDEPAIERLGAALELDGVIAAGTSRPVAVAARVAEKLGLAHPLTPATAMVATHPLRQREALAAAGVPQPRWQLVSDDDPALELELPVVVKELDRAGEAVPTVVEDGAALSEALIAARGSAGSAVLVEEYVDGPGVTVSGFSADGIFVALAVTDCVTAGAPAFGVPLAQIWPSPHAAAAIEVTRRAVEALGITDGPSLTQLRVSRGGPEVMHVAARLGGGHDAELVRLVTGVDLDRLALAAAFGEPLAPSQLLAGGLAARVGGAATRFLVAPPGLLASVEVPQGLSGIAAVQVYHAPGHRFSPLRRSSDRAGHLLAVGASREEAVARAEAAAERIRFVISGSAPAERGDRRSLGRAAESSRTEVAT